MQSRNQSRKSEGASQNGASSGSVRGSVPPRASVMPYFVAIVLASVIGMCTYLQYVLDYIGWVSAGSLVGMVVCAAFIVRGYFQIYGIFDKWDREEYERNSRT